MASSAMLASQAPTGASGVAVVSVPRSSVSGSSSSTTQLSVKSFGASSTLLCGGEVVQKQAGFGSVPKKSNAMTFAPRAQSQGASRCDVVLVQFRGAFCVAFGIIE